MNTAVASMNQKLIDQAVGFVRGQVIRNGGTIPAWGKYLELVETHLKDGYNLKFKLPKEYQYAYLRAKGLSDADALESMGIAPQKKHPVAAQVKTKSPWKFW